MVLLFAAGALFLGSIFLTVVTVIHGREQPPPVGRAVRLHVNDGGPSIEGVMFGDQPTGGHYCLRNAKAITSEDESYPLTGPEYWVPSGRVSGLQLLG